MGNDGKFTRKAYIKLSATRGYAEKHAEEIFVRQASSDMSPKGVVIRESRDSEMHPISLATMIFLDVTASMGGIPTHFVKEGMPLMMGEMMDNGIANPQILFGAIGDHTHDRYPLQVSQFESSTQRLDKWLTSVYLEGGGGGDHRESYLLAWYFAAFHTSIDCLEKRGHKGFLFTIGDEGCHEILPQATLRAIMGQSAVGEKDHTAAELVERAKEKYHVFHIHANDGSYRNNQTIFTQWRNLVGEDRFVVVDDYERIPKTIGEIVAKTQAAPMVTPIVHEEFPGGNML